MDDVTQITADNPGPFTLQGTNTWLVGRDPCWVVDPGPLMEAHLDRVLSDADERGGIGASRSRTGTPTTRAPSTSCAGGRAGSRSPPRPSPEPMCASPTVTPSAHSTAVATPGHAPDHLAFVAGHACFTGDAVLGHGSVFVAPDPGVLSGYLAALDRLRAMHPSILCPGHGPLVEDAVAKLDEYLAHRRERERRLLVALDAGLRSTDELLDRVWADAPSALRPAAAVTLAAHLDKLAEEGRLPDGVERPRISLRGEA